MRSADFHLVKLNFPWFYENSEILCGLSFDFNYFEMLYIHNFNFVWFLKKSQIFMWFEPLMVKFGGLYVFYFIIWAVHQSYTIFNFYNRFEDDKYLGKADKL